MKLRAVAVLSLVFLALPLLAEQAAEVAPKIPVAAARAGFTPEQARELRARYSYKEAISAGDVSLFHFLNLGIWLPTAPVVREGDVVPLATALDPRVGQTRISAGGTTLADYLASAGSRARGMVVVHRGRIVFEEYPGMRPNDHHVWMSTAKTTASLVVRLLAESARSTSPGHRGVPAGASRHGVGGHERPRRAGHGLGHGHRRDPGEPPATALGDHPLQPGRERRAERRRQEGGAVRGHPFGEAAPPGRAGVRGTRR